MSLIAGSYPFLNIMWSMFIFFALVIWVAFVIFVLVDNFKRHDHSGWAKGGWFLLILLFPVIGALIYIIARPPIPAGA
jgi:Phospholipase_D-nuclease N-terminal